MTPAQPFVSIGMPVYNSGSLLAPAIDSLLAQDFANFELIIRDDGSRDNTPETCRRYAEQDSRIRFMAGAENQGPLATFGRVLAEASGDYFLWAAHDDYRDPNYISALLAQLVAAPDCGLACARYVRVTPQNETLTKHPFPETRGLTTLRAILRHGRFVSAPWTYGLFRTAPLRHVYERVQRVGVVWFWDYLVSFYYVVNNSLTGTNATTLYQVKTGISAPLFKPRSVVGYARFTARILPYLISTVLQIRLSAGQKLVLLGWLPLFLEYHLYRLRFSGPVQASRRLARRWA